MNTNSSSAYNTNSIVTDENPIITGLSRNNSGTGTGTTTATLLSSTDMHANEIAAVTAASTTTSYNKGDRVMMDVTESDHNSNGDDTAVENNNNHAQITITTAGAAGANRDHSSPPPMFFVEKDISAAVAFQVQVDLSGEEGRAMMMEGTDAIAEVSVVYEGEGDGGGGGGGGNAAGVNSNSTGNNTSITICTTGLSTTEAYNGDTSTTVTATTGVATRIKRSSDEAFSISSESVMGAIPASTSFVAGTATVHNDNNGNCNHSGAMFSLPVPTIIVPPLVALTPTQQEEEHQLHHHHHHHLLLQQNASEDETHLFEPASVPAPVPVLVLPNDNIANKKRKTMTNGTSIAKNSVNNEQWDAMYERLKSYKQRYGDCLVPKRYAADPKLGTWVETQRVQYRKLPRCDVVISTNNNNDTANGHTVTTAAVATTINSPGNEFGVMPNKRLTAERLRRLTSIGFIWSAKHVRKNHYGNNKNSSLSNNNNNNNNATEMLSQVQVLQATTITMDSSMTNSPPNFPLHSDVHNAIANSTTNAAFAAAPDHIIIDTSLTMTEPTIMMMTTTTTTGETNIPQSLSLMQTQQMEFQVLQDHLQAGRHSQNYPLQQQYYPQQRRHRLNDAQWDDVYQRLVQYKSEFGDCLVPRKYEKDPKLSRWVETQRVLWNRDNNNSKNNNRKQIQHNDNFNEAAATMMEISNNPVLTGPSSSEGFTTLPIDPSVSIELVGNDPEINTDHLELLAAIDDTKAKRLTPERKLKLDNLGFVWSLRSKRIEDHWDEMFRQLIAYNEQHGDCLVPSRYEENLKLGKWVETQRYEFTKLQRALSTTKVAKQDQMQVLLNSDDGDSRKASDCIDNTAFRDNFATAIATSAKSTDGSPRPHNPRLTEDRLHRLESIGFQWKVKNKMKRFYDKQWDNMFEKLNAFKMDKGHCMVPKRYPVDIKLGTWVHTQRIQYRKLTAGTKKETLTEEEVTALKSCGDEINYRLTEERRLRLEGIGFVWSAREGEKTGDKGRTTRNSYDDQWDNMVVQLKQYQEMNGNCLVPKRYQDNPKLGTWVDTQRVQYKKLQKMLAEQGKAENVKYGEEGGKIIELSASDNSKISQKPLVGRLTDNRIQRLEQLGFVWTLRDDWQKHYEELKAYKTQYHNCNVPARYTTNRRLGIWVSAQRQQYKAMNQQKLDPKSRKSAPLTQERIKLLNDIGFTWTIRSRDSLGESWNARLIELKTFKAKYGHCLVPSRYAESPELGIWVGTQRTQFRLYVKSKESGTADVSGSIAMSEQRIHELEALDFVWALRSASKEGSATTVTATGTTSV